MDLAIDLHEPVTRPIIIGRLHTDLLSDETASNSSHRWGIKFPSFLREYETALNPVIS